MSTYLIISLCILYTTILSVPYIIELYKKARSKISFKETRDLTGLPIVTFYVGNQKLNFLLDTGSNNNIIDDKALKGVTYIKCDESQTLYGMDGIERTVQIIKMFLYIKKQKYVGKFQVTDMQPVFSKIKAETGVNLHGIVGSDFFTQHKYVLDYKEQVAFSKR